MTLENIDGKLVIIEVEDLFKIYRSRTNAVNLDYTDIEIVLSYYRGLSDVSYNESTVINAVEELDQAEVDTKSKYDHVEYLYRKYFSNDIVIPESVYERLTALVGTTALSAVDRTFITDTLVIVDDVTNAVTESFNERIEMIGTIEERPFVEPKPSDSATVITDKDSKMKTVNEDGVKIETDVDEKIIMTEEEERLQVNEEVLLDDEDTEIFEVEDKPKSKSNKGNKFKLVVKVTAATASVVIVAATIGYLVAKTND